ncbi:MAG: hypothetical protein GXZ02_07530 [Clostridiales bacterium]|nr:hypothetical protein [Clostridiales bacterium]
MQTIKKFLSVALSFVMIIVITPFTVTDACALNDGSFLQDSEALTITFDANGGTGGGSFQTLVTGDDLEAPEVLRTGYEFLGWSPEVPPIVPAENAIYIAQWSRNSYSMVFDANGGTGGYTDVIQYGENLMPPEVSRTGYIFAGWTPDAPSTVPAEDLTFTAHWSVLEYAITFDANDGIGGTSSLMPFGTDLIAPNVLRSGYTLTGWEPTLPATVPADATTYTAQWSINSYSITFDDNGGAGGASASYEYDAVLLAPNVSNPGFTFVGWSPAVPERVLAANSLYTAQGTPSTYNVTFDANGGTGGSSALMKYGTELQTPMVERAGYTFMGWSPAVPVFVPIGDVTYSAQWRVNSYSIVFDANGGTGGTSGTFVYGSALNPPDVVRKGYTFTGWSPAVPESVPSENRTYVAQWSQKIHTIIFDANGGEGGRVEPVIFGAVLIAPIVTRAGYTFTGWSPSVPATAPDYDVIYNAQWTANTYSLIFDADGGSGGSNLTVAYAAAIIPPVVKKSGYTFTGWTPAVPATMPANAMRFTATWTINMHEVIFIVDTVEYYRASVAYGNSILKPANPVMEGRIFVGWEPGVPSSMPDEALTFTAGWYILEATVSFNLNGGTGTIPSVQVLPVGNVVILPEQGNITKPGHEFLGWNTDFAATEPLTSYWVTPESTTLFAVWGSSEIYLTGKVGATTVLDTSNNLIYGLEAGLTKEKFESTYVNVNGNGRIEYSPDARTIGTGAKVTIIDNATNAVLQTFYIVIFGDVNGDGNIDSVDAGALVDFETFNLSWNTTSGDAYRKAADLNMDDNIDSIDAGIIVDAENFVCVINQATGGLEC